MANEFIIKNGYFSQGSSNITGSLNVTAGITGSLFGTASWAQNAITASFINVTNTLNASDYYIVGIDSDNGAQNPEQLYNFGGLAFNPDDNTLKVANGSGTMIGTASYATKAQNGFPYTGSAQITGSLGVTGSLQITGSTTTDLVRITQTGTGNAFVVEDSSTLDATSFIIDASGSVGIGVSSINSDYKTNIYTNSSTQATTLYVQNQSNNFSNTGTAIFGNGLSAGVFGYANGNQNPIGVTGYASDGITVIGVSGVSGKSEFGSADTTIGGYFESTADYGGGSVGSYAVQLVDGTQGIGKVLVSQTVDGKANWSTKLSGSYERTVSLAISGSIKSQSGNSATSDALLQATLLYLSNNF